MAAGPALVALSCGDPPALWESLGFTVDGDHCDVDGVRITLTGEGTGMRAWTLAGITLDEGTSGEHVGRLEGLRTTVVDGPVAGSPVHPNGVTAIDHVVVMTPDHERTITAFETAGLELRRTRAIVDTYGAPGSQAFFRPKGAIIELVGPVDPQPDAGGARFFGLAFTAEDLDAVAAHLGDRLKPAKQAVQKGRRIATLASSAGSAVPIAIMSPHVPGIDQDLQQP